MSCRGCNSVWCSSKPSKPRHRLETPKILKDLGLSYVLDWCADDQPFPLNVPGMISVPYATS